MRFKNDLHRRAVFAHINMFSTKPDYSLETWQKTVAGVPKYKIDEYYRGIWNKLEPQLKGRNVLVRYEHDGEQVVRRHPPGKTSYTAIDNEDDLSEIVREHGVELWPETSKKGNLGKADLLVLDIDNLGDVEEKKIKTVAKDVYKELKDMTGNTPYIVSTQGGYHVGVELTNPKSYKSLRKMVDKEVINPLEEEMPDLVSKHHGKKPIYLDKTPIKLHGSTKAAGSLNLPDLSISEKLSIQDIDGYRRKHLS
jgi:DNA primase